MKTMIMTLALLVGLPLAASAQVTKEDLKKLTAAGISDEVILSYVRSNGGVAKMSADDVIELKQSGASEKLLSSVLGGVQPAPAPVERTVERPYVTQPQTTYVQNSTPYYYTPTTYYESYTPSYASYSPYYVSYAPSYYPRSSYYYSSSCYPRSYYSSYYSPRYYSSYCSPSFGIGFSSGRHTSSHIGVGVSVRRR